MLLLQIFASLSMAQNSVIDFAESLHDFGQINEADGFVNYEFHFTNKGTTPLVIKDVQASCGCTTPSYTKEPIQPGKKDRKSVV